MSTFKKIPKQILSAFLTGIAVLMPIEITIIFFLWILNLIDGKFQPLLELFVPDKYAFALMGILFNIILIILAGFALKSRLRPIIDKLFLRIPIWKYIWKSKSRDNILESAIPAMAHLFNQGAGADGFIMGKQLIEDDTGFFKNKTTTRYVMFFPSAPVPVSGMPILKLDPQKVREIEVINNPGDRMAARAAILNSTTSFGSSIENVRLKMVEEEELKQLAEREVKKVAEELKKQTDKWKGRKR